MKHLQRVSLPVKGKCLCGDIHVLNARYMKQLEDYIANGIKYYSWPKMLKLTHFLSYDKFGSILPRLCDELIMKLPFREYTNPKADFLNLAVKLHRL
ncbi:hypothetical protein L1887_31714 [Cichorium endivia]|nr:hypothetical protein L1887_31714 [Cichorium endivia]